MAPRKGNSRRVIPINEKKAIVEDYEGGKTRAFLAEKYNLKKSTLSTILGRKTAIKNANTAVGMSRIFTKGKRHNLLEEMEQLLLSWIEVRKEKKELTPQWAIMHKARSLFNDLKVAHPERCSGFDFKATKGWFQNFKKRTGIHRVHLMGEAGDADEEAAEAYKSELQQLIEAENYLPQQIYNADETGLLWKRMPNHTFIPDGEKIMPGRKPVKDRLTLLLGANASGDCKLKPLLVYHSQKPRAFKHHNVDVSKLPVMWRSNKTAWVNRMIFEDWVLNLFAPTVKQFLIENNLPLKCLLLLDNAPGHGTNIEEILPPEYDFIKIRFLPPNTTSILQPMDQDCIAAFKQIYLKLLFQKLFEVSEFSGNASVTMKTFWKSHYDIVEAIKIINQAWSELSQRTLTHAWKKLCPSFYDDHDESASQDNIMQDTLSLARSLNFSVTEQDLLEHHLAHADSDLSTDDLRAGLDQEANVDLPEDLTTATTSVEIKEFLQQWDNVKNSTLVRNQENSVVQSLAESFDRRAVEPWRQVLKNRQKQTKITEFFRAEASADNE